MPTVLLGPLQLLLLPPISSSSGRLYEEALPKPSPELCGELGLYMAVGFVVHFAVYRGIWDRKFNKGSWSWVCDGPVTNTSPIWYPSV